MFGRVPMNFAKSQKDSFYSKSPKVINCRFEIQKLSEGEDAQLHFLVEKYFFWNASPNWTPGNDISFWVSQWILHSTAAER